MIRLFKIFIILISLFVTSLHFASAALYFGLGAGVNYIQFTSSQSFQSGLYKGAKGHSELLLQTKILPFVSGLDFFGGFKYLNANNTEATLSERMKVLSTYYGADLTFSILYLGFAMTQNHMNLNLSGTRVNKNFNSPEFRGGLKFNLSPKLLVSLGLDLDITSFSIPIELQNVNMQYRDLTGVGKVYFAL